MRTRSTWILAFKVVVSTAVIAWLLSRFQFGDFLDNLQYANYPCLFAGVLCFITSLIGVQTARLYLLLVPHGFGFFACGRLVLLGLFFNNLLPTGFGGDAAKALYIRRQGDLSWQQILAALGIERLSGLLVLALGGLVSLVYLGGSSFDLLRTQWQQFTFGKMLWSRELLVVVVGACCLFLSSWIRAQCRRGAAWLTAMYHAFRAYKRSVYLGVLAFSALFHALRAFAFCLFVRGLNEEIGLGAMMIILLLEAIVSLVPITIGALGIREGAISYGLAVFQVSLSTGIAVALFTRFLLLLLALWGGTIFLLMGTSEKRE